MKKIIYATIAMLAISIATDSTDVYAQKLDMRTRKGKAAAKQEKKVDAAVGAVNMANTSSDKNGQAEVKVTAKKNKEKVNCALKENYNKVKEGWKTRKRGK